MKETFAKNVHQDPIEDEVIAYGKGSLATKLKMKYNAEMKEAQPLI